MNRDGSDTPTADLGHNVRAGIRRLPGETEPDGVYYEHPCAPGFCGYDYVPLKPSWEDGWDLISEEPLTLSPSLLCRACGHHGFIRGGKWIPA